jgi:hypothetical protein
VTTPAVVEAAPSTPAPSAEPQAPSTPAAATAAPKASESEYGWTPGERGNTIERLAREGHDNHVADTAVQALAAKGGEPSIADLRTLPGTEGMSDAQLAAMWAEVNGTAAQAGQPRGPDGKFAPKAATEPAKPAAPRAWKVYDAQGVEITDLSKMTAEQFLQSQIGYQANKAEQRRAFDEVVRNAQLGHYNSERMNQLLAERNTTLERARDFENRIATHTQNEQTWTAAIAAAAQGKFEPLQALVDAYNNALGQPAPQPQQDMVPRAEIERQQAGERMWNQLVAPRSQQIAQQYGLDQGEVDQAIHIMLGAEPAEFLTRERLDQIIDTELPYHIERARAEGKIAAPAAQAAPAADARDTKIAQLERDLAAARAGTHNATVAHVHQTRRTAPPAAATASGSGGSDVPNFSGAADAREWLRNLK